MRIGAACLALAALSLLLPSSPTYDPWAWIVWGREVLHLDLSTVDGPSWKPLPVLFTTVFALFGSSAAPALWLVVARAGAIAAVVLAFRVARRLGGPVAGAAAAGGLVLTPWFVRHSALGNSEGLMAAAVLLGIELHLAGQRRAAFAAAIAAGLLRPEAWPFVGLYALWLVWTDRALLTRLVLPGLAVLPVLWLGPELWGSGNLWRAADRAKHPLANSPALTDHPAAKVLDNFAHMLAAPVWVGLGLVAAGLLTRRVDARRAAPVLAVAVAGVVWAGIVAAMTARGFSGNERYLIMPAVLLIVAGAAGLGWAVDGGLRRIDLWSSPVPQGTAAGAATLGGVAALLSAGVFALPSVDDLGTLRTNLRYQGHLSKELARAVDAAGGASRLRRCGRAYTGPFLVPAVAWQLHLHTTQVALDPRAPGVVFRVETNPGSAPVPSLRGLGAGGRTLAVTDHWRIVARCGA